MNAWSEPLARSVIALWSASTRLVRPPGAEVIEACVAAAEERGHFRPSEEELLAGWFARFVTVRAGLWQVIDESSARVGRFATLEERGLDEPVQRERWRGFVSGFAAACVIVLLDRYLTERLALGSLTQRKLNEGSVPHRVPRKQYTRVFESLTAPDRAMRMLHGMNFARRRRATIDRLSTDTVVGVLVERWDELDGFVDDSKRSYLRRLWRFSEHALRRAGASARQQLEFDVLEGSGRAVSEMRDRWTPKRVTEAVRGAALELLRPGDFIVTRHDGAFTNLFLPGFWPHAALYIGDEGARERLGVRVDAKRRARWSGARCVLEALKDGVRFRPLEETLGVDAFTIARPRLPDAALAEALSRAVTHEGKLYNFDFDFFRSDRLVCTEVIYRGFDGVAGLSIPIAERAGRPVLSAEDLLQFVLDDPRFAVLAAFGVDGCENALVTGNAAARIVEASLAPLRA